jgi:hypothetical protein
MTTQSRRDVLCGVAELAAVVENAWLDAYHADIDERRDELGWDRVEELLTETLKASDARCEAMLREMIRLPAGAAS